MGPTFARCLKAGPTALGYADFCTEIFGMLCVSTEICNLLTPSPPLDD